MARRVPTPVLVPTGLFLAAAARVRMASAYKLAAGIRDAETAELFAESAADCRAKLGKLDRAAAEYQAAKLTSVEVAAATAVALERTASGTEWANAARELLSRETINIADQREVGCLSRAACR